MHYWGDEWFRENGDNFNKAISFCSKNWRRWGRIGYHGKEKYGTFRHHVRFYTAEWGIYELINPGYICYWWKLYPIQIDKVTGKLLRLLGICWLIQRWQFFIYNLVLQIICNKYPELIDELIVDSEYPELIKPGFFGKVDGKAIHDKYWTSI